MKRILLVFFTLNFLASFISCSRNYNYDNILIRKAIDGDTLILANGQRLRLIGIDTPEINMNERLYSQAQRNKKDIQAIIGLGRKASEFTKRLVEGEFVKLEFDDERYDKYGRLLAYVYLKDGTFLNAKIIEEGFAYLLTIPPNVRYTELFKRLYRQARENKRGLWSN